MRIPGSSISSFECVIFVFIKVTSNKVFTNEARGEFKSMPEFNFECEPRVYFS